jgi:hypothetical protein
VKSQRYIIGVAKVYNQAKSYRHNAEITPNRQEPHPGIIC